MNHPAGWEETDWIALGQALKPRGLRGEIKTLILTDSLDDFDQAVGDGRLWSWREKAGKPLAPPRLWQIEAFRFHQGNALLLLEGIATPEAAEELRGLFLGRPRTEMPEEEGYYYYELENLRVESPEGVELGRSIRVEESPAHPLLVIQPPANAGGAAFRLPLIAPFVEQVEPEKGRIIAHIPPGLREAQVISKKPK